MAEYGRIGLASDYVPEPPPKSEAISRIKTQIIRSTRVDLGDSPHTLAQLRELVEATQELPGTAKITVTQGTDQREGASWLTIIISG